MIIAGVDFKTKTVEHQNKKYKLQVWDTAGQERYNTIRKNFYRGARVSYIYIPTPKDRFTTRRNAGSVASPAFNRGIDLNSCVASIGDQKHNILCHNYCEPAFTYNKSHCTITTV